MRWALLALVLMAGCTEEPGRASVDPPQGTEWAECPPIASRGLAVAFRGAATNETGDLPVGIHRIDERHYLHVWGTFRDSLREDRITRLEKVDVALDPHGVTHICARVNVATPTDVDTERRSFNVGVLLTADDPLPPGPVRVVVNWTAGCPCDPLPRGNVTAFFD